MKYLGNHSSAERIAANGGTVYTTVSRATGSDDVFIDGVYQFKNSYTFVGNTLTFTTPISAIHTIEISYK